MKLTLGQIADWIHAEGDFTTNSEAVGYSIDSRTIGAGELFFAVTGERMDGHDYVAAALANGAVAAVVSNRWLAPDEMDSCKLLYVPEGEDCVLSAMQTLARHVRGRHVGQARDRRHRLGRQDDDQGGDRAGAVGAISRAEVGRQPEQPLRRAAATAAARAGARGCGDRDGHEPRRGARRAGRHRPARLGGCVERGGRAPGALRRRHRRHRARQVRACRRVAAGRARHPERGRRAGGRVCRASRILYGTAAAADVRAEDMAEAGADGMRFTVAAQGAVAEVHLQLLGRHNVLNALAAIAVGLASGMALAECAEALAGLAPTDKRGTLLEWRGATIINDCYNSNPVALDAMVDALLAVPATRHIVVAGEMLELGPEGAALHRACGATCARAACQCCRRARAWRPSWPKPPAAPSCPRPEAAGAWLAENLRPGDAVLLKASRGVRLERALDALGK